MDQFVIDVLNYFNLESFADRFKEEEICESSFKCLTYAMITELIPRLGPRAKFWNQFEALKANSFNFKIENEESDFRAEADISVEADINDAEYAIEYLEDYEPKSEDVSDDNESFKGFDEKEVEERDNVEDSVKMKDLDYCTEDLKALLLSNKLTVQFLDCKEFKLYHKSTLVRMVVDHIMAKNEKRTVNFSILETYAKAIERLFPNENAKYYFKRVGRNPAGKLIERYQNVKKNKFLDDKFDRTGDVDENVEELKRILSTNKITRGLVLDRELYENEDRRMLVQTLMQYLMKKQERICSVDFIKWATAITNLFPNEHFETYYSTIDRGSKGKLVNCYSNLLQKQNRIKFKITKVTDEIRKEMEAKHPTIILNDVKDFDVIKIQWMANFNERREALKRISTANYFHTHPILQEENGYEYLIEDFNRIYPTKANIFSAKLADYALKILKYAQQINLIDQLEDAVLEGSSTCITNYALILLPFLFENTSKHLDNTDFAANLTQNYIIFSTDILDGSILIEARNESRTGDDLEKLPVILAIGENILTISEAHILYENVDYKFKTLEEAVATCIKMFIALDKSYCSISGFPWAFLQKSVMDIAVKNEDRFSVQIAKLLNNLRINKSEI